MTGLCDPSEFCALDCIVDELVKEIKKGTNINNLKIQHGGGKKKT